jgi:hypothetical protein
MKEVITAQDAIREYLWNQIPAGIRHAIKENMATSTQIVVVKDHMLDQMKAKTCLLRLGYQLVEEDEKSFTIGWDI